MYRERVVWWGEAPERPCGKAGEPGGLMPNDVDTSKHVPSRGRVLDHGSARFQAYQCRLNRNISRFGSIIEPYGSLAPPKWNRPFALSPIRLFAMLLPYDDPSRCY
jgi:hypothetical protein